MIARLLIYIVAACIAALLLGTISQERFVTYESRTALFLFAGILGLLNASVKPLLQLLAWPITCLTFVVFALVINAGLFALAAAATLGMRVTLPGAVLGALLTSIVTGVVFSLLDELTSPRRVNRA